MPHYASSFIIERLALDASIGLYAEERAQVQPIAISVRLYFPELPDATSDDEGLFIDYDALCKRLIKTVERQHFQLIEYMAHELFKQARGYLDEHEGQAVALWLKLTKCKPAVPHLEQGASFVMSDLPPGATVVEAN